jgi:hypothetical protein
MCDIITPKWTVFIPYFLYVHDYSVTLDKIKKQIRPYFPYWTIADLIESSSHITKEFLLYLLYAGDRIPKSVQLTEPYDAIFSANGIYSVVISPVKTRRHKQVFGEKSYDGHEFIVVCDSHVATIVHSYTGQYKMKDKYVTVKNLTQVLQNLLLNSHQSENNLQLYNEVFNANEQKIGKVTVTVDYYGSIPPYTYILDNKNVLVDTANMNINNYEREIAKLYNE